MRTTSLRLLAMLGVLFAAGSAQAVIMKLTHLPEVIESQRFIFVAGVDKVDPDRPSAVFKLDKHLKGMAPFDRIPVNMTGDADAKKGGDTKTILDRLDGTRKVVFFVSKSDGVYDAMAFVEGSWFSLQGTIDPADKTVRWAFLHGEPFLRRTFKGTSAEMMKVVEDGLAKKAKPPMADEKEKPGYGPAVEKEKKCGARNAEGGTEIQDPDLRASAAAPRATEPDSGIHSAFRAPRSALLGVIPSLALVGPMAALAALFPGVFARLAVGMKRWRAFLVVASTNSTLALLYWLVVTYWPEVVPGGWWFGLQAFTLLLTGISAVGLAWAGRRYRRMAAAEPAVTQPPSRPEVYTLAGLTAFAALSATLVWLFGEWSMNLELPMREFTFIGVGLLSATVYAAYRRLTAAVDRTPDGTFTDRRLSVSGESVGLAALFLCGFLTVLMAGRGSVGSVAAGTVTGDADVIGPRLVSARALELYQMDEGEKVTVYGQVMSGLVASGDRFYFGMRTLTGDGRLVCMDPATGELTWSFRPPGTKLKPVFCTPTLADGKVYCGEGLHDNDNCRLFCVNAGDGKAAWDNPFQVGSHTEGAPAVVGGKVFFPAGDDGLIAADAKTGGEKWRFKGGKEAGIHVDAAPAVSADGKRVFIGSGLYTFVAVALDADTGNPVWRTDLKARAFGAPLVSGKFVYFGVGTGNMGADVHNYPEEGDAKEKDPSGAVVCLEAETGKEVWRYDLARSVHTGLVGDAFSVYAASRDGYVYALDRKTGKLRWRSGVNGGAVTSPPAVATAGGVPVAVYAVSQDGNVVCLNPHTGKLVWQARLPGYHYLPNDHNDVLSGPTVVTIATPTGSKRTVYVGAMIVDPDNPAKKTGAVFRFQDEIGGE